MSAILASISVGGPLPSDAIVHRMLDRMRDRATGPREVWRDEGAVLAVARHAWEQGRSFSGPAMVVRQGFLAAVADASLFYRDELRRALAARSVRPLADTPTHLVLAAYQAWGERCAERLEGDFAFLVWDGRLRRVFCSRDLIGARRLYYARIGGTLVVASTAGAIAEHPDCPPQLNLLKIAEAASGYFALSDQSAYQGIAALAAGQSALWRGTNRPVLWQAQQLPPIDPDGGPPFEDAAEQLRETLREAVRQRLDLDGPTSIHLSGGYDSPAVFAAGESVLRDAGREHLRPVSVSYPVGDPGREDELIAAIAAHWHVPVHWLDIRDIPLMDAPQRQAAQRDEPYAHVFQEWNLAVARGSRAVGCHVALNGAGGDELFNGTAVYLADLLRAGRWISVAREWEARGAKGTGFRSFCRAAVIPMLSPAMRDVAEQLRGRRLFSHLEFRLPPWIKARYRDADVLDRADRAIYASVPYRSCADRELYWSAAHPSLSEIASTLASLQLREHVESRSPLWDRRVVALAYLRPHSERTRGRENKRLLRHAVRRDLPASVVAPRTRRTGSTVAYFDGAMRTTFRPLLREVLHGDLRLAELGIVEPRILRASLAEYLAGAGGSVGLELFDTFHAELWVRARAGEPRVVPAQSRGGYIASGTERGPTGAKRAGRGAVAELLLI